MTWNDLLRGPVDMECPPVPPNSLVGADIHPLWESEAERRQELRLLLAWASGRSPAWLPAHGDEPADAASEARFRDAVSRRLLREPVAYILGTAGFFGHEFEVGPAVLIPRPDTELLVEIVSLHVSALAPSAPENASFSGRGDNADAGFPPLRLLDIGTGSGCIPISLLLAHAGLTATAVDLSANALDVARRNAAHLGVDGRMTFLAGDFLVMDAQSLCPPYDIVVSNPPYIPSSDVEALMPDVRAHEPRMALDGGADGLVFYRRLAGMASHLLRPGGLMAVEIGWDQGDSVPAVFRNAGLNPVLHRDLEGRARVVTVVPDVTW